MDATAPIATFLPGRGQNVSSDVTELYVYAAILLGLILLMIIIKIVMKVYTATRVGSMKTPFAVSPEDLDRMKGAGQLTPEEARKVRAAMARQILERQREEEEARRQPPKAEIILSRAEEELRAQRAATPGHAGPQPGTPGPSPEQSPPREAPPPEAEGEEEEAPAIPARLRPFLGRSDVELEQLVEAGFLRREDYFLLLRERERGGGHV